MKKEGCDDLIREVRGVVAFFQSGRSAEARNATDSKDCHGYLETECAHAWQQPAACGAWQQARIS
jgi:hypothetical protein